MRYSQNDHIDQDSLVDLPRTPDARRSQINSRTVRKKTSLPLYIGVGLIVFILVAAVAAVSSKSLRHQIALSIVRQPTPYTQLYFSHAGALPVRFKIGQKNSFDFTIVNNESRAYRYTYTVTLDDSRSHSVVSIETVTIDDGGEVTRPVTLVPKDHKANYLVTIALEGMNQSIHFYAETS
jgi:hypothetical protein